MNLLIDADFIVYKCCAACETEIDYGEDVIFVTSNSVNAVPNIKINPVTVPIRPSTTQVSAINHPVESVSLDHLNFLRECTFFPIQTEVTSKTPKIKNPIKV